MTTNRELFAKYAHLDAWIETGSCLGRSIAIAVELGFQDIRSVEAQPERYEHCRNLFADKSHVRLWCGESIKVLPEMLSDLNTPALIWCDAHPSGAGSYEQGAQSENLILELTIIARHHVAGHVILIDDLTSDIDLFARTLFPSAQIHVHDTDEGLEKVMEIRTAPQERTHLSQNGEAVIIANFFGGHIGTFLDIGASGGVALSNTFELGLRGWHGLFVEPSPIHFANLLANYHNRGGFRFVNAALWRERTIMQFSQRGLWSSLVHAGTVGSFDDSNYWVPTVTAADLAKIEPNVDFISLDIEGADTHVFPSLAEAYPNCRLWAVEHANNADRKQEWYHLFAHYDLKIVAETPENFIAGKL